MAVAVGLGALMFPIDRVRASEPQASTTPAAAGVEALGPKVGETLPDFDLADQHGQRHSLKSSLAVNGAVIVFFRSADW